MLIFRLLFPIQLFLSAGKHKFAKRLVQRGPLYLGRWLTPLLLPPRFCFSKPPHQHGFSWSSGKARILSRLQRFLALALPPPEKQAACCCSRVKGFGKLRQQNLFRFSRSYPKPCAAFVLGNEERNDANEGMMDGGSEKAFCLSPHHWDIPSPFPAAAHPHPGVLPLNPKWLKTLNATSQQNERLLWASLQGTCLFPRAQFFVKQNTWEKKKALNAPSQKILRASAASPEVSALIFFALLTSIPRKLHRSGKTIQRSPPFLQEARIALFISQPWKPRWWERETLRPRPPKKRGRQPSSAHPRRLG